MKKLKDNISYVKLENEVDESDHLEYVEILQGSLIDNYLIYNHNKDESYLFIETYVNSWKSTLTMYLVEYDEGLEYLENLEKLYNE